MPTLAKAKLTESESPWLEAWDAMYAYLLLNRSWILALIGFYAEHDLPVPIENRPDNVTKEEDAELWRIATALTYAATASEVMPTGVLIATLKKVSKKPYLHYSGSLPEAVQWAIASYYRRGDEKFATHSLDVLSSQPRHFVGQVEVSTELNIARAARSAIQNVQRGRGRGRPCVPANQILADNLGEIFRSSGLPISRRLEPVMRGGKAGKMVFVEAGPFCDFLRLVLPPLQKYLWERELATVTIGTIVRLVTEDFPRA
jgi:hypothetical protein